MPPSRAPGTSPRHSHGPVRSRADCGARERKSAIRLWPARSVPSSRLLSEYLARMPREANPRPRSSQDGSYFHTNGTECIGVNSTIRARQRDLGLGLEWSRIARLECCHIQQLFDQPARPVNTGRNGMAKQIQGPASGVFNSCAAKAVKLRSRSRADSTRGKAHRRRSQEERQEASAAVRRAQRQSAT